MAGLTIEEKSVPALVARLAADLQQQITTRLSETHQFTLALSGGGTPRQLYELLAEPPYLSTIPWDRVLMFWGDERCVPPTHPESNFRMANEALLQHVPVAQNHIIRMKGELPPALAAADYQGQLKTVFGTDVSLPVFDLILLGLGPDGHTASLFPGTAGLTIQDRWVTENQVPALNTTRLTLTFPVLNNAAAIWFLAAGQEKANAYAHVRGEPTLAYPASMIRPLHGSLQWYVDASISRAS